MAAKIQQTLTVKFGGTGCNVRWRQEDPKVKLYLDNKVTVRPG